MLFLLVVKYHHHVYVHIYLSIYLLPSYVSILLTSWPEELAKGCRQHFQ